MLTRLQDNGLQMCHRYWPEEGSEQYHIFEVIDSGYFKIYDWLHILDNFTVADQHLFSGSPGERAHLVRRLPGALGLPQEHAHRRDADRHSVPLPVVALGQRANINGKWQVIYNIRTVFGLLDPLPL